MLNALTLIGVEGAKMWIALFLLILSGNVMADDIPTPNFKEPTGLGWDKAMHFGAGALANEMGSTLYNAISKNNGKTPDPKLSAAAGLMLAVLAGLGKECLDSQEKGNKFDMKDWGATVLGAMPAATIRFKF